MERPTYKLTVLRRAKTAVSFANMSYDKISKTAFKTTVWKRYMYIFSLWDISKPEQVNLHCPTIY